MIPEKNNKDLIIYNHACFGAALKNFVHCTEESDYTIYKSILLDFLDALQKLIQNDEFKSPEEK